MPDRLTTSRCDALLAGLRPAADPRDRPSEEILDRIVRSAAPHPRRRLRGRRRAALIAGVVALSSSGVAVAADLVFQAPKPDPAVPRVAEWTYFGDLYGDGPVLVRPKAEWLSAANRAQEDVLRDRGIDHPRCGIDPAHPLACYLPDGSPVAPPPFLGMPGVVGRSLARDTTDIRHLTPGQAHDWLCRHPEQRPGADFGEKPAPTQGFDDCPSG